MSNFIVPPYTMCFFNWVLLSLYENSKGLSTVSHSVALPCLHCTFKQWETVTSQQEGPGCDTRVGQRSFWSLHVFSRHSSFQFPQSKHASTMHNQADWRLCDGVYECPVTDWYGAMACDLIELAVLGYWGYHFSSPIKTPRQWGCMHACICWIEQYSEIWNWTTTLDWCSL